MGVGMLEDDSHFLGNLSIKAIDGGFYRISSKGGKVSLVPVPRRKKKARR
jgi:hypothetical protein